MVSLLKGYDPFAVEKLPEAARVDFEFWRTHIEPLLSGRPAGGLKRALAQVALATGKPIKTVSKRYYRARDRGLLGLVDRRLCGPRFWRRRESAPTVAQCKPLQELFKTLCGQCQRNSHNAYLLLCDMWKKRDPQIAEIPEYADFPGWPGLPRGWGGNGRHLERYAPARFELVAARQGRNAANAFRSTVYTSRVGLWVGSHILFDDKWHDLFVNSFAHRQHGRPLEVYAFDLFSAKKLRWGARVRTKDEEGNYQGIAEVMMRFVLAATLHLDGYSPRGTILVAEHGTAAVRETIARRVHDLSGGVITLSESGMTGDPAHMGQYPGLVRGNPRHKAALESNNNLEHNRLQHLPGQTGKDVVHRPEELAGRLDYNATLLAAYDQLPPERAALLEFPLLEFFQYMGIAQEIYDRIADDRTHRLEGWIEAGNVLQEYSWGGQPLLETALSAQQRGQLPALLASGLLCAQPVRMTRREVWDRGAGELIRFGGAGVCAILGDDLAREVRCTRGEIEISDPEVAPSILRYEPFITTHEGRTETLREGETYQAFVNPFDLHTLFLRDARGAYLGAARRIHVPSRGDFEAVQRAMGAAAHREAELLAPLRARTEAQAREKLRMHRQNAAAAQDKAPAAPRVSADRRANNARRSQQLADAAREQLAQLSP